MKDANEVKELREQMYSLQSYLFCAVQELTEKIADYDDSLDSIFKRKIHSSSFESDDAIKISEAQVEDHLIQCADIALMALKASIQSDDRLTNLLRRLLQ